MAAPAINSLYRLVIFATDTRSIFANVRHYRVTAVGGAGASDALVASTFNAAIRPVYLPIMASTVGLTGFQVQRLTAGGVALTDPVVSLTNLPALGTDSGDQLPSYVAGVLSVRTGVAGRRTRGRFYTFPAGEASNSSIGTPEAAWVANAVVLASQLLQTSVPTAGGDSTTLVPVVFSKSNGGSTVVSNVAVRPEWGTIRHRKIGRGQ